MVLNRLAAAIAALLVVSPALADPVVVGQTGMRVARGDTTLVVDALAPDVIRVRIGRGDTLPEDASWGVDAATRARRVPVRAIPGGFTTLRWRVTVDPATLSMTIADQTGRVVVADAGLPVVTGEGSGARGFTLRKRMTPAEHYFGLGDKTGGLDRRGGSFVDWNSDAYGFTTATDPIYKSIPFFVAVGGAGGNWGMFLDNSWRTWFDFGHREADTLAVGAPDGPIDYYLIFGPTTAEVVRHYADLTGHAPLPPRWSLGYQQSRYSYANAAEVREVALGLRANRIPADVLWLDIDWQDRNAPFTVDMAAFPDMAGLVREQRPQGLRIVAITDLHIAAGRPAGSYPPYDQGSKLDAFVRRPDGTPLVAPVWPGPSVFPDFTLPRVRDWWGTLFRDQVAAGIAGAWNDMNEPAVFGTPTKTMPLDAVHRVAGDGFAPREASHAEIHNVFGMENARATWDGLRNLAPDERPYVMTRASYAGGQRYGATWTGDNLSTWDHLRLSVQQILNLGLSGFAWSGADVGGFAGGPNRDLLTRWFEIGAFYPVFRNHSAKGSPRVEPWVDGAEHLAIRRRFIEERYRLLPYLYALADANARTGDPVMRPVFYDYPDAIAAPCDQSWSFTLGRALLVAPPPSPESPAAYDACLPAGDWFDYWTGRRVESSPAAMPDVIQSASQATGQARTAGRKVRLVPHLETLPVFVRGGTILPRAAVVQSTDETPSGPLHLDVYPGDDCVGELYLDDGHSTAFARGMLLRQKVRCRATATGLTLTFGAREGRFAPWWRKIAVTVHGWSAAGRVSARGRRVAATITKADETLSFVLPDMPQAAEVTIDRMKRPAAGSKS